MDEVTNGRATFTMTSLRPSISDLTSQTQPYRSIPSSIYSFLSNTHSVNFGLSCSSAVLCCYSLWVGYSSTEVVTITAECRVFPPPSAVGCRDSNLCLHRLLVFRSPERLCRRCWAFWLSPDSVGVGRVVAVLHEEMGNFNDGSRHQTIWSHLLVS